MKPRPSQTRWTFVPNPPRERPRAWSAGSSMRVPRHPPAASPSPLFPRPGGSPAGPDDRAVDAPEVVVEQALVVQFVEQRGDDADPGALATPGIEAAEHGLP